LNELRNGKCSFHQAISAPLVTYVWGARSVWWHKANITAARLKCSIFSCILSLFWRPLCRCKHSWQSTRTQL